MDFLEVGKRYRITTARGGIYEGDFSHYINGGPVFEFCAEVYGGNTDVVAGVRLWGRHKIGFRAETKAVFEEAQ